jgi:hypothetical protein
VTSLLGFWRGEGVCARHVVRPQRHPARSPPPLPPTSHWVLPLATVSKGFHFARFPFKRVLHMVPVASALGLDTVRAGHANAVNTGPPLSPCPLPPPPHSARGADLHQWFAPNHHGRGPDRVLRVHRADQDGPEAGAANGGSVSLGCLPPCHPGPVPPSLFWVAVPWA